MANVKITELTAYTNPASTDVVPIVDLVNDQTKKVTIADLLENAGAGSASAAAFAFDGDSDTGMYRSAANSLAFTTGGTGRLVIDSSGNFLFQQESASSPYPEQKLKWSNDSTTANGFYISQDTSRNGRVWHEQGLDILFGTTNSERLRIDSSGNIKLTSSAYQTLAHKSYGYGGGYGAIVAGDPSSNTGTVALAVDVSGINGSNFAGQNQVIFPKNGGLVPNNAGTDFVGVFSRDSSDSLVIGPALLSGKSNGPMTLTSTNVGIGVSAPDTKLHVGGSDAGIRVQPSNVADASIFLRHGSVSQNSGLVSDLSSSLIFYANGAERARIASDGVIKHIGSASGDETNKLARYVVPSHDTNEEDVMVFQVENESTFNQITFGGGTSSYNAATQIVFRTASAVDTVTGSEAARFDSSGRLLVGTSSSLNNAYKLQIAGETDATANVACFRGNATGQALLALTKSRTGTIGNHAIVQNGDNIGGIQFRASDGTNYITGASIETEVDGTPGTNDMPGRLVFSTTADGASSPTERMRIGNTGRTHVYNSAAYTLNVRTGAAAGAADYVFWASSAVTDNMTGGSTVFSVFTNGNVQNTNNSYTGISDIKLKENIFDANSQWDDLKALQVRNYNFKEETGQQTHTQIGLIAQEVETVSPGLVSESPDRDEEGNDLGTTTKSVNYSVLYMKAVKALQEAMDRIETLEAKVAALEAN